MDIPHAVPFTDKSRKCFESLQWGRSRRALKGVSGIWRERQFIHLSAWILAHPPVLFHAATPTVQRWAHVLHKLKLHGEHLCVPHKAQTTAQWEQGISLGLVLQLWWPSTWPPSVLPHLLLTTPVSHTDKTGGYNTKTPHLSQEEPPKHQCCLSPEPAWMCCKYVEAHSSLINQDQQCKVHLAILRTTTLVSLKNKHCRVPGGRQVFSAKNPTALVRSGTHQRNLCTSHLLLYNSADSSAQCVRGASPEQKTAPLPTQTQGPKLDRCFLHVDNQPNLTKFVLSQGLEGEASHG